MKITVHLNRPDWKFQGLPDIYLPNHEVCLCYMYVKLSQSIENSFVTLASTLVDRSPCNETQELASFYNDAYAADSIIYKPTHLSWYKLQCQHLSESFFELQLEKPHKNLKIEKLYLQLEARKICKVSARH